MPEVRAPLFISSRLMAALKVGDGTIHLSADHITSDGRLAYAYLVEDSTGATIHAGNDLCTGVGTTEVDYTAMMATFLAFADHDGDEYRAEMDGTPWQEWCYQNSDEIGMARCELDPEGLL